MAPTAEKAPALNIPQSSNCCHVSIINTTCDIVTPLNYLVEPDIPGYNWLNLPTYSFYIKNEKSGKELVFDLGCRKDFENSVPHIVELLRTAVPGLRVDKNVTEILAEGGINIQNIDTFILSHWHFDHNGDPSLLSKSTKMIVGPGFRDEFLPGWPANEKSTFHERDFEGREVIEPPFSDDFKIGKFQAHDYLGDGSIYILNVPGHATGHISALVRTTPDTFVFLGGDVCHHSGVIRPTPYIPLPDEIPEETAMHKLIQFPCPCGAFSSSHPEGDQKGRTTPFFKVSTSASSFYHDPPTAQKSVEALKEFDANPNILTIIAHDPTTLNVFDFFPKGRLNDWQSKGWKKQHHWGFLSEMPYQKEKSGKKETVRGAWIVDGLYEGGEKKRGLNLS